MPRRPRNPKGVRSHRPGCCRKRSTAQCNRCGPTVLCGRPAHADLRGHVSSPEYLTLLIWTADAEASESKQWFVSTSDDRFQSATISETPLAFLRSL